MKRFLSRLPLGALWVMLLASSPAEVPLTFVTPREISVRVGGAQKIQEARLVGRHELYAGSQRIVGNRLTLIPASGGGLDAGNGLVCDAARCLLESEAVLEIRAGAQSRRLLLKGEVEFFNEQGSLLIVARIPFEEYIRGVVYSECGTILRDLNSRERWEYYTVMAACARSWALAEKNRHEDFRYEVCDLTHCQNFHGCEAGAFTVAARKLVLVRPDNDNPLCAWYHSTCGGRLTSPQVMWPEAEIPAGFFRAANDVLPARGADACAASPHYRWQSRCSNSEMETVCGVKDIDNIEALPVQGRVRALRVYAAGNYFDIPIARFLSRAGRELGWNRFKSNDFELRHDGEWIVTGRGLGHGVGLCQYGAAAMIKAGCSSEEVLHFYYPGALLRKVAENAGE